MRRLAALCALAIGIGLAAELGAQRRGGGAPAVRRETPKTVCSSVAGVGANTKRRYCDVRIAEIVEEGIRVELPARTGAAVLQFDIHNRFIVSGRNIQPMRQDALVALVSPEGKIIERGVVRGELRTEKDLFDRLAAASGRGTIATAPGQPQRIRASVPAGMAFVALVGLRQDIQWPARFEKFETAGRPIALASNFEIAYTPSR